MKIFTKSFVTKRDSLKKCSFVPAGSDEPLSPSDIFSLSSAEPAGHEPTYLRHFSSIWDVLGLVLPGNPCGLRVRVWEGTGTGRAWRTHGLPALFTTRNHYLYEPVSPHIVSWDEIEELKDFSGALMVTFNEAYSKPQRAKRNIIEFMC